MKVAKDRISNDEDAEGALYTLYAIMLESLKMLGCLSPMISEHLYQRFYRKYEDEESIFLTVLSQEDSSKINQLYEKQMETVKEVVSVALLARQTAGIKVRWPIRTLYVETKSHEVSDAVMQFEDIILSLLNVKEIKLVEEKPKGELATNEFANGAVHVDKKIDEELYEEGLLNEVKRRVQMMRKEEQLVESDKITLTISTEKEFEGILKKYKKELSEAVNASHVGYGVEAKMNEYTIDGRLVKLAIKKEAK
jgi:isoleucyl-tRNA synthetase